MVVKATRAEPMPGARTKMIWAKALILRGSIFGAAFAYIGHRMPTPESRAHQVLESYLRDVGNLPTTSAQELLRKLIAEAIQKAVTEDRVALRESMACDSQDPCAFERVCSHHKALAGAILGHMMDADAA